MPPSSSSYSNADFRSAATSPALSSASQQPAQMGGAQSPIPQAQAIPLMNQTHQSACESLKTQYECLSIAISSQKAFLETIERVRRNTEEESIRDQVKKDELRRQQDDFVKKETEINKRYSESVLNLQLARGEKEEAAEHKSKAESIEAKNNETAGQLRAEGECIEVKRKDNEIRCNQLNDRERIVGERETAVQTAQNEFDKKKADIETREAEISRKHSQSETYLKEAKEQKEVAAQLNSDADRIATKNKTDEDRINTLLKREQEIIAKETNAKNDVEQAKLERIEANEAKKTAKADREMIDSLTETAKQAYKDCWPDCLATEKWFPLRQRLLDDATRSGDAALVVAAFYRFCAAKKSVNSSVEICNALQDLGKRLYLWTNHNEVADIGAAFNAASDRVFSIRCASPDKPVEEWMNYQPGLVTVKKVCSWAVSRAEPGGIIRAVSKADVT